MAWQTNSTFVPLQTVTAERMNVINDNLDTLFPYDAANQIAYSTSSTALGVFDALNNKNKGMFSDGTSWSVGLLPAVNARVYNNANQTIPSGIETTLTWNSEYFDTGDYHSIISNTSRFLIPYTGYYWIGVYFYWVSLTSGHCYIKIKSSSSGIALAWDQRGYLPDSAPPIGTLSTIRDLSAGNYVEAIAYQTSGVDIDLHENSSFMITLLGKAY